MPSDGFSVACEECLLPLRGGICPYDPEHTSIPEDLTDPDIPEWYFTWLHLYQGRDLWPFYVFTPLPVIPEKVRGMESSLAMSRPLQSMEASDCSRKWAAANDRWQAFFDECGADGLGNLYVDDGLRNARATSSGAASASARPSSSSTSTLMMRGRGRGSRTSVAESAGDSATPSAASWEDPPKFTHVSALGRGRGSGAATQPAAAEAELRVHSQELSAPHGRGRARGRGRSTCATQAGQHRTEPTQSISAWLLEIDATGGLGNYCEAIAASFASPAEIIEQFAREVDGKKAICAEFYQAVAIKKLGHKRLLDRWFQEHL